MSDREDRIDDALAKLSPAELAAYAVRRMVQCAGDLESGRATLSDADSVRSAAHRFDPACWRRYAAHVNGGVDALQSGLVAAPLAAHAAAIEEVAEVATAALGLVECLAQAVSALATAIEPQVANALGGASVVGVTAAEMIAAREGLQSIGQLSEQAKATREWAASRLVYLDAASELVSLTRGTCSKALAAASAIRESLRTDPLPTEARELLEDFVRRR